MSTVGQLVDRLYREYLYAPDDTPSVSRLTVAVDAVATSLSYQQSLMAVDEEELFGPGIVIEVDRELMLVTDVNHVANTVTVARGYAGTTAVSHVENSVIRLAPTWARQAAFDAVRDSVVALYPSLWNTVTQALTTTSGYTEVPAGAEQVLHFRTLTSGRPVSRRVEFVTDWGASSTGKAIITQAGLSGYLTYRTRFPRPDSEQDDLALLGVEPQWERIVVLGAAAQLLAGREGEAVSREFLTETVSAETYPEGSTERKRNSLVRLWVLWMAQAHRELVAREDVQVVESEVVTDGWSF